MALYDLKSKCKSAFAEAALVVHAAGKILLDLATPTGYAHLRTSEHRHRNDIAQYAYGIHSGAQNSGIKKAEESKLGAARNMTIRL